MTTITPIPVPPSGKVDALAFVERAAGGSGFQCVPVNDYPPSPRGERLRAARLARDMNQRDAAKRLGVGVAQYSGIESGRYTLSEDDWWAVHREVRSWAK